MLYEDYAQPVLFLFTRVGHRVPSYPNSGLLLSCELHLLAAELVLEAAIRYRAQATRPDPPLQCHHAR